MGSSCILRVQGGLHGLHVRAYVSSDTTDSAVRCRASGSLSTGTRTLRWNRSGANAHSGGSRTPCSPRGSMIVGQVISHRQYGVGVITKLLPDNPTLVKAVFEGEEDEKIVQVKYSIIREA